METGQCTHPERFQRAISVNGHIIFIYAETVGQRTENSPRAVTCRSEAINTAAPRLSHADTCIYCIQKDLRTRVRIMSDRNEENGAKRWCQAKLAVHFSNPPAPSIFLFFSSFFTAVVRWRNTPGWFKPRMKLHPQVPRVAPLCLGQP